MVLNLISIINNSGAEISFNKEIDFGEVSFGGSVYNFDEPVSIKGFIKNVGGVLKLSAHLNGKAVTSCDRCGKAVTVNTEYDIDETFSSDPQGDDCILLTGTELDIKEIALENFYSNADTKYLCKPDCKGLCQYCGVDRNVVECSCHEENFDPRLSALNDLFNS